jgi:hypothetical protein
MQDLQRPKPVLTFHVVNCDDLSVSPSTQSTPTMFEHNLFLNESPIKKSSEKSSSSGDQISVSLDAEEESPTNPFKVEKESTEKLLSEQIASSAQISS